MKKSLLGLLLAVALVVPAFAEQGDMSINGKVGFGLNNYGKLTKAISEDDSMNVNTKFNVPVSLTAEFFYEFINNLSAGIGVNYSFDSNSKVEMGGNKLEAGTTNIYLALKPEARLDSSIFTSIYIVGQIGVSMNRLNDKDLIGLDSDPKAGLYLGFGAGTTIANQVLVELLCTSSNGKIEFVEVDADFQYTAVTLNVGYKFSL